MGFVDTQGTGEPVEDCRGGLPGRLLAAEGDAGADGEQLEQGIRDGAAQGERGVGGGGFLDAADGAGAAQPPPAESRDDTTESGREDRGEGAGGGEVVEAVDEPGHRPADETGEDPSEEEGREKNGPGTVHGPQGIPGWRAPGGQS